MLLSFCSFHLVYQLKIQMKLNGRKWLYEIEQKNSEKKKVFGTETNAFFACWLLISEMFSFAFNKFHDIIVYTSKINE